MVIYLDLIFLLNFTINSLFVYVVNIIYKERIRFLRIFFAGLIGGFLVLGFLFDYFLYSLIKIFGGVIVGLFGFKIGRFKEMIVKISTFYIINFVSVGFVASFRVNTWYLLMLSFAAIILIFMVENSKKPIIFMNACKYNISVSSEKKNYKLLGFLDTGNFSKCDDLPIVYFSKKYQGDFKYYKTILVKTVGGSSALACYKPRRFEIEIDGTVCAKDVLIVFTDIAEFDCLLNVDLFI